MDAEQARRQVLRYQVFQDSEEAAPLAECDFYLLLEILMENDTLPSYLVHDSVFQERLNSLHELDVSTITSSEYQAIALYAARHGRCDLLERWMEQRGNGSELLDAVSNVMCTDADYLLCLLPQLLDRGELGRRATINLLQNPVLWPYLVGYICHPIYDLTSKFTQVTLWQFLTAAYGASAVADPRILYRALTAFGNPEEVAFLWSVHPDVSRELVLEYRGAIGTIRELFDLRQIRGLPGLPLAPFAHAVFSGETAGLGDIADAPPDLEEHLGFCRMRHSHDPVKDPKYLSWLLIGSLSDGDYTLLHKLNREQPRRALQYVLLAIENHPWRHQVARASSFALIRLRCLVLLG